MLNKKGFTMVELMVSISLIALIMIFLVKILIDVRYEGTNEIYDVKDQVSRAEIIKTIQNNIALSRTYADGLEIESVIKNGNTIRISLSKLVNSGSYITRVGLSPVTISVATDKITYTNTNSRFSKTASWPLELTETNADVQYSMNNATCSVIWDSSSSAEKVDYAVTIVIPVYMGKSTRSYRDKNTGQRKSEVMDSTLDNISLTFYGRDDATYVGNICRGF